MPHHAPHPSFNRRCSSQGKLPTPEVVAAYVSSVEAAVTLGSPVMRKEIPLGSFIGGFGFTVAYSCFVPMLGKTCQ